MSKYFIIGFMQFILQLFNLSIVRIKAVLDKLVWACLDEILKSYFQLTVKLHTWYDILIYVYVYTT